MSRPVAIVDIDGTVADARHRLHLIAGGADHDQWVRFFDAAGDDPPIPAGVALVIDLARRCDIVWITGRPERTRELTEKWLVAQGLPAGLLIMIQPGDDRPTREVKLDHVRAISEERTVAVVVDDDPRVVAALRESRLPVRFAPGAPGAAPPGR